MLTTFDILDKYKARLNKSDSSDYDNLWIYQVEESFNKGVTEVLRRFEKGKGEHEAGETTKSRVDDLRFLLKDKILSVGQYEIFAETSTFPEDYLYYKRLTPLVTKNLCKKVRIKSHLREEANVDDLLTNYDSQPSFDFEETFNTLIENRSRVYHNKDFKVEEVILTYYKKPRFISINRTTPIPLEFSDDLNEIMIDEGIKIMAGDIESWNQKEAAQERTNTNN